MRVSDVECRYVSFDLGLKSLDVNFFAQPVNTDARAQCARTRAAAAQAYARQAGAPGARATGDVSRSAAGDGVRESRFIYSNSCRQKRKR